VYIKRNLPHLEDKKEILEIKSVY